MYSQLRVKGDYGKEKRITSIIQIQIKLQRHILRPQSHLHEFILSKLSPDREGILLPAELIESESIFGPQGTGTTGRWWSWTLAVGSGDAAQCSLINKSFPGTRGAECLAKRQVQ